ncbi:MAG TPA: MFS transporter [Labilithrix sp.]|nr:MFS transporter [Labilithrix sp.]
MKLSQAQWRTLFVVWLTYGAFYLCRVNIGPARVEIERGFGLDALEMGLVLGALKIGYAIGQLVNGQLAERFGPKRILLFGMFGSVTACLLFASAGKLVTVLPSLAGPVNAVVRLVSPHASLGPAGALLLVVWFANGYFQAGGWPPTVKIMAGWFTPTERGRMMGILGTSYQLGSALTIAASGMLVAIAGNDWRAAFIVPAVIFGAVGIHARFRMQERPAPGEAPSIDELSRTTAERDAATKAGPPARMSIGETLFITFTNPRIWILALALFGLDIVRYGFLDWAPGHLKKLHGSGVMLAGLKVAVFPLAGGLGALASGWVTDRWFQSRRAPVIAVTMGLVGLLTLAFDRVAPLGAVPTVACLALIGFFLYGAQILLVGTAAQDFAKRGTTAAAAGFVDFMGYMGAFGGDVVTGWLLKNRNFHAAITFWATAAIVAAVLSALLWRARPVTAD